MWASPIPYMEFVGVTNDSDSFVKIDITTQFEVPVGKHCGAFGAIRKHDIHQGVDLYCPTGTPVFAVEDAVVTNVRQFTGEALGFPWWRDTWAVYAKGATGTVVYGEIRVCPYIKEGMTIEQGTLLGWVEQVLKKDKGRPMSMLHLALKNPNVRRTGQWMLGTPQPLGLMDPTSYLLRGL